MTSRENQAAVGLPERSHQSYSWMRHLQISADLKTLSERQANKESKKLFTILDNVKYKAQNIFHMHKPVHGDREEFTNSEKV